MKNTFLILLLFLTSCSKSSFDYLIPEGTPYLEDIQKSYADKLIAKSEGWYLNYQIDGVRFNLIVKFKQNGLCDILSDVDGFHFLDKDIKYKIAGLVEPELQFTSYSAFSDIFEHFKGGFEFTIKEKEDVGFQLVPIKGVKASLSLVPATTAQYDDIAQSAHVIDVVNDFSENAIAYFKNFEVNGVKAFLDLNMATRKIVFSWVGADDKILREQRTFNYKANGITWSSPVTISGKTFSQLNFGSYNQDELEIVDDESVTIGRIFVSHTPSITFPHTADAFLYRGKPTNLFAYTGDDLTIYASPDLAVKWEEMRQLISPSLFRITINTNTTSTNGPDNVTFLTKPDGAATNYWRFDMNMAKSGEDHVTAAFKGTNSANANNYKVQLIEFLDLIFPAEGVTIMPLGRYSSGEHFFRIISRKNSRIYFNVRISTDSPLDYTWE
ncbi:DUF4302 domain-containing protein [Sphingobacterium paucimobilis]|uniref:DUF4302 domain-containing protein n=1 Tax=Sphingobacterium paucimobilis HER1398 TaxID=1346330 RepID=U2HWG9_9SPHI|nr:DUF4302 domain-containing protein [Sphingobacterium paucimobilis]ERJ59882.1 hypothetical protein M472_14010 [Sphingobacterium paucimobilis HER1398]